jgi:hypothetical protein
MAHKGAKAGKFEVRIEGGEELNDNMEAIAKRLLDGKVFMAEAVEMMQECSIERWESDPWAPEAPSTQQRKASEGLSTQVFRDQGSQGTTASRKRIPDALYHAVTSPHDPGQVRRVTKSAATFGIRASGRGPLFYARFASNVKGVKRRILAMNPATVLLITEKYRRFIMGYRL